MIQFILGLIIKLIMLFIFVIGFITTKDSNPESAGALLLITIIMILGVLEHIFNPRNELTGEYRFF